MNRTVAISGASSFTALWIAKTFKEAGWDVFGATAETSENECDLLRQLRLRVAGGYAKLSLGIRAENGSMAKWIEEVKPSVWINHHHYMPDFRAKNYDYSRAMAVGVEPVRSLVSSLASCGCLGAIQTGSYFEPLEGGRAPDSEVTPYGKSKHEVWETLRIECESQGLLASKVVISDPIGPFENNDRLIPILLQKARSREPINVTTPNAIGDRIAVQDLANSYLMTAQSILEGETKVTRPSGWVGTVNDWIDIVNVELLGRVGLEPVKKTASGSQSSPSLALQNPEAERIAINWPVRWDEYAEWIKKTEFFKKI